MNVTKVRTYDGLHVVQAHVGGVGCVQHVAEQCEDSGEHAEAAGDVVRRLVGELCESELVELHQGSQRPRDGNVVTVQHLSNGQGAGKTSGNRAIKGDNSPPDWPSRC